MNDNNTTNSASQLQSEIATRIKNARIQNKLTQKQVAEMLKISPAAYTNYENVKRSFPHEILLNLCPILGITMNYIYTGENINNPFGFQASFVDFDIKYNKWIAAQNFFATLGYKVEFFSATHPEDAIIMIDYVDFTPSKFNVLISSIDNLIQTAMDFVEGSEDYASVLKPDLEMIEYDDFGDLGNLNGKNNI